LVGIKGVDATCPAGSLIRAGKEKDGKKRGTYRNIGKEKREKEERERESGSFALGHIA